jgi:D-alanyl-D-alanine carboxypeptidase
MSQSTKSKVKLSFLVLLSVFLGASLVSFFFDSSLYSKAGTREALINANEIWQKTDGDKSQEYFYFIKNIKSKPSISAEAYLVGDIETGEIIMAKNKDKVFPIASVSKLMTALVSTETQDQNGVTTISKKVLDTQGQNGSLQLGEKIKTGDLLYSMLLESSNDAAEAIASAYDRANFIEDMNDKVGELGLSLTSFTDPSGLSEKNTSTVSDLFLLSKYLKNNKPEILDITTKRSFSNKKHIWFNNSQFLNLPGYLGRKRGYIDESKQTALSVFSLPLGSTGTKDVGIILLRSADRQKDTNSILKYLNNNVYYGKVADAKMDWVKQKEGILEEKDPNFLTFVFGGDMMLDRGVKNSVMKNFEGDYSALFEKLGILKKVDIAFANLEGTASDKGSDKRNLYSFRMDPSVVPALKGAGFSILSTANNHVGDWGRDAYTDTLKRLDENEILHTGGGLNKNDATKPTIIEKYGIKIGFLGFSDVGPNWMEAKEDEAGLLLASDPNFDQIIKDAASHVDHLIVSFHFGEEYKTKHSVRQEYLAHKAIDAGAKIVIGHHPHVVEDTEIYKNGFIAYSLGNFIFDQYFSENTMQGMLLEVKLGIAGDMTIKKNILKLNSVFKPEKIIEGKEEKIKFEETKVE